jgi:type IV secretory pathway VirB2 component (pilin)
MWDELRAIFTGPVGPWICLVGLVVISLLWLEGERLLYTPLAFAWAALIVARHFDFAVVDQYMLLLAVFFGVYYAMPHRAVLKQPAG